MKRLKPIDLVNARLSDPFWDRYTALIPEVVLPYQWRVLNDAEEENAEPSHALLNFSIAAGEAEGDFYGFVFQDSDAAKWLEAAACSLASFPDPELEKKADEIIALIGRAQKSDGYLDTYFQIRDPGHEFTNLREGHELYCAGHLIEAGVAYFQTTGKRSLLDICIRLADHIVSAFHTPELSRAIPGHEEIELALVRLYEVTGREAYLDMAAEFIERRGQEPPYFFEEMRRPHWKQIFQDQTGEGYHLDYAQADIPVRLQKKAEGHAVRAVYLYCAMADIAAYKKDAGLLAACERLYQNIVSRQMYITGGIGSSGWLERFTTDYDLPNDSNYAESCASIGLALFCRRMAQLTRDASYMDTAETALYNTVLAGISMDGKRFFYVNPLSVWPPACMPGTSKGHVKPVRQSWFGCACCPPNIARTLASLAQYAYFTDEDSLYINLYISGTVSVKIGDEPFTVTVETAYPFGDTVLIRFEGENPAKGRVALRVPSFSKEYSFSLNGGESGAVFEKGYLFLERIFENGDELFLSLDMTPRLYFANPLVRADAGRCALKKGPLVYCLEEADNGENLEQLLIDPNASLTEDYDPDLLGGTVVISAKGWRQVFLPRQEEDADALYAPGEISLEKVPLTFVPYPYWGNRKNGEMIVFVRSLIR